MRRPRYTVLIPVLAARVEAATGVNPYQYAESPGDGVRRYVFTDRICLGGREAVEYLEHLCREAGVSDECHEGGRNIGFIGHPDAGKTALIESTGAELPNGGPMEFDGEGGST